jgi:hypothetical protein
VFCPLEESGISDVIARYLSRELEPAGIFTNREVEVVRKVGASIGHRTDILINAVRRGEDGRIVDALKAVIEMKGCWNSELFSAIDAQLVKDYVSACRRRWASIWSGGSTRRSGTPMTAVALRHRRS